MAPPVSGEIERQFAQLPTQIQLHLIERLIHRVRTGLAAEKEDFALEIERMAEDPQIRRELENIETEFRGAEGDGLSKL